MSAEEERPPARRRAPVLRDPMSPTEPVIDEPAPARPKAVYDPGGWSGFTAAMGGRIAVEAKELLAPLAKAYGLKTERAMMEKLIVDAARKKMPNGPTA